MEQTAGKWGLQSGDSDGVSIGKRRLPRFVESHQKLGHLTACSSQVRVIVCAQWIACEAKNDALSISIVIFYVKQIAQRAIYKAENITISHEHNRDAQAGLSSPPHTHPAKIAA